MIEHPNESADIINKKVQPVNGQVPKTMTHEERMSMLRKLSANKILLEKIKNNKLKVDDFGADYNKYQSSRDVLAERLKNVPGFNASVEEDFNQINNAIKERDDNYDLIVNRVAQHGKQTLPKQDKESVRIVEEFNRKLRSGVKYEDHNSKVYKDLMDAGKNAEKTIRTALKEQAALEAKKSVIKQK